MTIALIQRKLDTALTAEELIDELRSHPPKSRVVFACSYGDHGNTEQILPVATVDEVYDDLIVYETRYSNSGLAVRESTEDDEPQELDVVVLRMTA